MNWYKKSQEEAPGTYFDVGHYDDYDDYSDKRIVLWISDRSGNNFRTQEVNDEIKNHSQAFGHGQQNRKNSIWGRYDYDQNTVSIALPLDTRIPGETIDPNELPNNLMDRLISEFSGAGMYGFGNGGTPIRIM